MSTTAANELQALYDNLNQIRIVNNVTISCVAFLVHDILTNLDKEIPLIWRYYHNTSYNEHVSWRGRARRILVQTLFVFGRYYAPLYLLVWFTGTVSTGFLVLCSTIQWNASKQPPGLLCTFLQGLLVLCLFVSSHMRNLVLIGFLYY
ncbi:hypothetical protein EDC04DRAFT_2706471 [Pisolithus marmoratus]|nr:hypothetical protein EDC04DRAFT_2706471 [Pisolithus marmoratus]